MDLWKQEISSDDGKLTRGFSSALDIESDDMIKLYPFIKLSFRNHSNPYFVHFFLKNTLFINRNLNSLRRQGNENSEIHCVCQK